MTAAKISKDNLPSKLYQNDLNHIKRKVTQTGETDDRFKNCSAAIRHYVHLGIITEKRTEAANTLDSRIIKAAQSEVVRSELQPLKNTIDDLIKAMEKFEEKQSENLGEMNKQMDILIKRFEFLSELLHQQFGRILQEVNQGGRISEETLRNLIVLRSIQYVFLIGYKTGRIEPSERTSWEKLVAYAHQKAQTLSLAELAEMKTGTLDENVIENFAGDLFLQIKKIQNSAVSQSG